MLCIRYPTAKLFIFWVLLWQFQDGEADKALIKEYNYEITECMRIEMEYISDRAWWVPNFLFDIQVVLFGCHVDYWYDVIHFMGATGLHNLLAPISPLFCVFLFSFGFYFVKLLFRSFDLWFSFSRYDREEGGNTMFDADSSSVFLGDEASFQKKKAEAKKLVY